MKIYYTHSIKLPEAISERVEKIIENSGGKLQSRVRPKSYSNFDLNEAESIYRSNVNLIKSSDIVIADISYTSSAVGYEISLALEEKKPVICIYNIKEFTDKENLLQHVPVNLKGNTSKYLLLKEYSSESLPKLLELAIKDAKSLADTKFILIIPPEIDKYLEWNVREKGVSKAEITRHAIENMMADDKAYLDYMKSYSTDEASNS